MSLPQLQRLGDSQVDRDIFAFEHAMAMRELLGVMAPLSRFSGYPYLRMLDPMFALDQPGAPWHFTHQQAHNDAMASVPSYFGAGTTGLFMGSPLRDYNLSGQEQRSWWTHVNEIEHQTMANAAAAAGTLPPAPTQPLPPVPPIPWPPQWWVHQSGRWNWPFS